MAACAFSQAPVGMDIEKIRPFRDLLISRILTPQEQEFLEAKSKTQNSRQEWFFRFWTLKESYIKYTGQGLSMPLNSFSFSFTQTEEGIKITSSLPGLTFRQILLRENHLLSVCSPLSEPIELVYPD
jgi:4'-phosphopantetheinyl transferase